MVRLGIVTAAILWFWRSICLEVEANCYLGGERLQISIRIEQWADLDELIAFITKIQTFIAANPEDTIKVVF
jgi:hypothetical protein